MEMSNSNKKRSSRNDNGSSQQKPKKLKGFEKAITPERKPKSLITPDSISTMFVEDIEKNQESKVYVNLHGKIARTSRTPIQYFNKRTRSDSMFVRCLLTSHDSDDIDTDLPKDEMKKILKNLRSLVQTNIFDINPEEENESALPLENRHVLFEDCTLILRMKRGKASFAINIDWNKRHVVREEAFSKEEIEDFFKGKQIDPSNNQSGETAVVDIDLYFED